MPRAYRALVVGLVLLPLVSSSTLAQLEPPSTGGAVALAQELRMLGHQQRVLLIAAHPDDEDTELLTVLVRRYGVEAAYLSLNRGEGGQNLIGDELGEALGVLRTEELRAARRLDGAQQFFTRAYDFGFSKSLEDTWAHWPRDSVLKDVVRVVRRFRPQVIVAIFSGTSRDGHGHHQASGWAAREAFRIAADSSRFPELFREEGLPAWHPLKLYRSTRFDSAATTLTLPGGALDPVVGQSYHQIAMRGRSLHRSQDMGRLQGMGPSDVRLQLEEDRTGAGASSLMGGIDTTLAGLPTADPEPGSYRRYITRYVQLTDSARRVVALQSGRELIPLLAAAQMALDSAMAHYPTPISRLESDLERQAAHLERALGIAAGLVVDAVADDERVIPGQPVRVTISAWNTGGDTLVLQGLPRSSWFGFGPLADSSRRVPPGAVHSWTYSGRVSIDVIRGAPYYLRLPRQGDMYRWPWDSAGEAPAGYFDFRLVNGPRVTPLERGLPFEPAPAGFIIAGRPGTGGWRVGREVELVYRYNDQARGEIRRPLIVVPRVDVRLDPATEVWRAGSRVSQRFTITLTHGARDTTSGQVSMELPAGWPRPAPQRFRLTRAEERQLFTFVIQPPPLAGGSYQLRGVATDDARVRYDLGVVMVDYPHIRPRGYLQPARATVQVAPLVLPLLSRVGYIRGAADRVPEALQSVGLNVEVIPGAALAGDLVGYQAIVVGPRAFETDPGLVANNDRLLAYARSGGLVITQYQQYDYFLGGFPPYPLTVGGAAPATPITRAPARIGATGPSGTSNGAAPAAARAHDRVTDETAPVTILDPASPVALRPNRLSPTDWEGWVQERGLYFAASWDPAWTPVLEMHDPGEPPLLGGLLIARVGKGTYVYTGLAFFRQLPAGVPGAYRLFANMLALAGSSRR